jgi:hypothetical protein
MDVLNSLLTRANDLRLLQPLLRHGNGQRVSLYADDVVLFLQPSVEEFEVVKEILRVFGEDSGLITNLNKCSMTPIQCGDQHLEVAQEVMPSNMIPFPCKYLGLPISVKKLPKRSFLELIDKIANNLPGWKAALINPAGRAVLVKSVLTAIPIYHLIALQCPKWVIKAIGRIRRGFLWKGRTNIKGGHCTVGWARVCRPLDQGGLGIHNLEVLGWALNMRWLWLRKTQPNRPWNEVDIKVHPNAAALFSMSICSQVGDGATTLFWTDRWLHGKSILEVAPALVSRIPKRVQICRTVQEALVNNRCVNDISGSLPAQTLIEYFLVWDLIQGFQLQTEVPD